MAIANVAREAGIGLLLTAVMILVFLGSPRATVAGASAEAIMRMPRPSAEAIFWMASFA